LQGPGNAGNCFLMLEIGAEGDEKCSSLILRKMLRSKVCCKFIKFYDTVKLLILAALNFGVFACLTTNNTIH